MYRKLLFALAATLLFSADAVAYDEPHLGEIVAVPYTFCPRGWLPADGRLMTLSQNTALFSLFSTQFGGNGTQNFALPKMSALAAPANGQGGQTMLVCVAPYGIFPVRPY